MKILLSILVRVLFFVLAIQCLDGLLSVREYHPDHPVAAALFNGALMVAALFGALGVSPRGMRSKEILITIPAPELLRALRE